MIKLLCYLAQTEALTAACFESVEFHRLARAKLIRIWNISPKDKDEQVERFMAWVLGRER